MHIGAFILLYSTHITIQIVTIERSNIFIVGVASEAVAYLTYLKCKILFL